MIWGQKYALLVNTPIFPDWQCSITKLLGIYINFFCNDKKEISKKEHTSSNHGLKDNIVLYIILFLVDVCNSLNSPRHYTKREVPSCSVFACLGSFCLFIRITVNKTSQTRKVDRRWWTSRLEFNFPFGKCLVLIFVFLFGKFSYYFR